MNRIRATEGLRGVMDLGLPADPNNRLRDAGGASQAGAPGNRDLKAELYERLASTNKKYPPPS